MLTPQLILGLSEEHEVRGSLGHDSEGCRSFVNMEALRDTWGICVCTLSEAPVTRWKPSPQHGASTENHSAPPSHA